MCSICSKSIFSDLVQLIYCIVYVESNHSSSRVFSLWKLVQNQFFSFLIQFMYILNRIIQALICLAYENWFWIDSNYFGSIQSSSGIIWIDWRFFRIYSFELIESLCDYTQPSCNPDFIYYTIESIQDFSLIKTHFFSIILGQLTTISFTYICFLSLILSFIESFFKHILKSPTSPFHNLREIKHFL